MRCTGCIGTVMLANIRAGSEVCRKQQWWQGQRVVLRQYSNRPRFTYADVLTADQTKTASVWMTLVPIALGDAQRSHPRQRLPFARVERNESTFTAPAVRASAASNPVLGGARPALLRMPVRSRR